MLFRWSQRFYRLAPQAANVAPHSHGEIRPRLPTSACHTYSDLGLCRTGTVLGCYAGFTTRRSPSLPSPRPASAAIPVPIFGRLPPEFRICGQATGLPVQRHDGLDHQLPARDRRLRSSPCSVSPAGGTGNQGPDQRKRRSGPSLRMAKRTRPIWSRPPTQQGFDLQLYGANRTNSQMSDPAETFGAGHARDGIRQGGCPDRRKPAVTCVFSYLHGQQPHRGTGRLTFGISAGHGCGQGFHPTLRTLLARLPVSMPGCPGIRHLGVRAHTPQPGSTRFRRPRRVGRADLPHHDPAPTRLQPQLNDDLLRRHWSDLFLPASAGAA
jgi:hypothetical protein